MPPKRKSRFSEEEIESMSKEAEENAEADRSDENSSNTDYNNLYNEDCYDDIVDDEDDDYEDDDYEDDEDDELDEEVVLLDQTDGEDRNCSNNASANIASNKASTNLTQSNLTSGPSSTISMYPIFHPQNTNTKDTPSNHANKTYIRPKVTSMDAYIKTSKVPSNNAPPKSSAPNLLPEIKLGATNHVLKNQIKQLTKAIATNKMKSSVLLPKSHIPRNSTSNPKSCINETSLQLLIEGQNATIQLMNNSLNIVNGLVDRRNLAAQDPNHSTSSAPASWNDLSHVNIDSNLYLKSPTLLTMKTTYVAPTTLSIPKTLIKNPDPCKHYLNGQCWYGDTCRFSHTT